MYRTGDLARWQADGTLEFLGRRDDQIKIRGYRVELCEVETVLATHPDVGSAAVIATGDRDVTLTAYVVPQPGTAVAADLLQNFLKERLPAYMIPSAFVPMPALPLTVNGKVDRRALAAVPRPRRIDARSYAQPATTTEELLASVWADVLGVPHVDVTDNFFERGGHSLLAMRVIARASAIFKRSVPLKLLFEAPTVRGLARAIDSAASIDSAPLDDVLARSPERTTLPVALNQEKRLITEECLRRSGRTVPPFNLSLCLQCDGDLRLDVLQRALDALIRRHEILHARFFASPETAGEARARKLFTFMHRGMVESGLFTHSIVAAPSVDLQHETLEQYDDTAQMRRLAEIVQREVATSFDHAAPPLIRVTVVKLRNSRHALVIVLPHLICDAAALQILKRDLTQLYQAFVDGRTDPLPALTHQFSDFAQWQPYYLNSPDTEPALAYWSDRWSQFSDARLRLTDFVVSDPPDSHQASEPRERVAFRPGTSDTLRRFARESNATLYTVLLTTFYLALHRVTGRTRFAVWANCANRTHPEFLDVLGWFVNSHLLGIDIDPNDRGEALLAQVQLSVIDATTHQALPTSRLWQALGSAPVIRDELPIFFDFHKGDPPVAGAAHGGSQALQIADLRVGSLRGRTPSKGIYITVVDGDPLDLRLAYNVAAISQVAVRRLLTGWCVITESFPEHARRSVMELIGRITRRVRGHSAFIRREEPDRWRRKSLKRTATTWEWTASSEAR